MEAPYGSHPGEMYYLYDRDEEIIKEWVKASEDPQATQEFLKLHIYDLEDHQAYLKMLGNERLQKLATQNRGRSS